MDRKRRAFLPVLANLSGIRAQPIHKVSLSFSLGAEKRHANIHSRVSAYERISMDGRYLLSIEKAAEALSIGRSKTYDLIKEGRLATVMIGRRRLVCADSVRAIARGEAA